MIKKKFTVLLLTLAIHLVSFSQSVYHLQYNFNRSTDPIAYDAILLLYNNGSGLARINYMDPVTKSDVTAEMITEEEFLTDASGKEDTGTMVIRALESKIIRGDSTGQFLPPAFIFRINPVTGYFEPVAVSRNPIDPVMAPSVSFSAEQIEGASLDEKFIARYFSKQDELYNNLFLRPKSRGASGNEKNITFHLLVVADIQDTTIGGSCNMDMQKALQTFDSLRKFMGINKFISKTIAGKDFSKKNVQLAIKNLRPLADDIVVFYYSGHGYRLPEQNREFPNLKLKTFHTSRKDVLENSMNIEDIFISLKKKGARFNLVLSDCCNDDMVSTNASGPKPPEMSQKGSEGWSPENVKELFMNDNPMSVLATAAQNGQRASSNNSFGGFFSFCFRSSLDYYSGVFNRNVSWEKVLTDAKKGTVSKARHAYCKKPYIPENICEQVPHYIIINEQ